MIRSLNIFDGEETQSDPPHIIALGSIHLHLTAMALST